MTMIQNKRVAVLLVALLVISVGSYGFLEWLGGTSTDPEDLLMATSTPGTTATTTEPAKEDETPDAVPETSSTHGYGTATLRLNEIATFPDGLSIRPIAILEDSRCPQDVQCIQAGTVRLSVRMRSASGVSTNSLDLGSSITTEAQEITFLRVSPANKSTGRLSDADYRFTFEVRKRNAPVTPDPAQGSCYVGGCSGQICSDNPNAVSTCEFRAEYACYKSAKCERQPTGQCGWTETNELRSCLANPPKLD